MKKILIRAGWLGLWLIGPAVFLIREGADGLLGFPLDDAWIHQTYARSRTGWRRRFFCVFAKENR